MPRKPTVLINFLRDVERGITVKEAKEKYGNMIYNYHYSGFVDREGDKFVLTEKGREALKKYGGEDA